NMLAHSVLPMENAEKKKIQKRIWKRLSVGVLGKSPFLQNVFLFRMGIAASVLLGLFGVFWLSQLYFPNEDRLGVGVEGGAAMTSYANDGVWSIKSEDQPRSEEHTSELQSRENLVCRLLLEKKKKI